MASQGMNSFLAQAYGTNGSGQDSDIEKTAQALMLNKLAEQEGIDLSGLDEQQLSMLAQEVSQQLAVAQAGGAQQPGAEMGGGMPGGGMPMPPPPMQPPPGQGPPPPMPAAAGGQAPPPGPQNPGEQFSEEQVKVAQAKMAEADFLGRLMAHAMHQESKIIKEAEFPNGGGSPFPPSAAPPVKAQETEEEKRKREEEEAEKTAMAYLSARGYSMSKQASSEGALTRAIRALGGNVK